MMSQKKEKEKEDVMQKKSYCPSRWGTIENKNGVINSSGGGAFPQVTLCRQDCLLWLDN